jgi:hypothetical protein
MSKHESSRIPDYLLKDCTPAQKWLMENVFDLKQNIKSLQEGLERVEIQTTKTNGRVTKSEDNIENLQNQIKSWINLKNNIINGLTNKYVIIGAAIGVFLCLYPLAIYVSKVGGPLSFFTSIAKSIWG